MLLSFETFLDFNALLTEAVNKHSTHIEEKFLTDGKKGLSQTVAGLTYVVKTIGSGMPAVSLKIDGIAVFFGYTSKGFFVASKSIFNKTPKVNYTSADIDINHPSGPGNMLKDALIYLKKITPKQIGVVYQGDYLFSSKTLKSIVVDGEACYAWQPNIIEYTVSKNSTIGKTIGAAKFGICVHTKYSMSNDNFSTLNVTDFGISKDLLNSSKDVFLIDSVSSFGTAQIGFDEDEANTLKNEILGLMDYSNKINWTIINPAFCSLLMPFINNYVKSGNFPDIKTRVNQFTAYIDEKKNNAMNAVKTDATKFAKSEYYRQFYVDAKDLTTIFELFDKIMNIKLKILERLDKISLYKNFVITTNGDYIVTKDEGFVLTKTSAKGAKLVDRLEFSRNNFSKDIVSGFVKR